MWLVKDQKLLQLMLIKPGGLTWNIPDPNPRWPLTISGDIFITRIQRMLLCLWVGTKDPRVAPQSRLTQLQYQ